jgi:hypothetical protein
MTNLMFVCRSGIEVTGDESWTVWIENHTPTPCCANFEIKFCDFRSHLTITCDYVASVNMSSINRLSNSAAPISGFIGPLVA